MKIDGTPFCGPDFESRRPNSPIKGRVGPSVDAAASQIDASVAAENRLAEIDLADRGEIIAAQTLRPRVLAAIVTREAVHRRH